MRAGTLRRTLGLALGLFLLLPWRAYGQSSWGQKPPLPSFRPTPRKTDREKEPEVDPDEAAGFVPYHAPLMPAVTAYAPFKTVVGEPPVRLVNSKKIRFNYQVRGAGPSGVEAVEIWGTRDGLKWQRFSQDTSGKPPFIVEVPEEGRYGFTLLVRNGVGISRRPPEPGETPQMMVEVDLTSPAVQLTEVQVGKGRDNGLVAVSYKARDRNLGPQPIAISYATNAEGPWKNVAANLENTGRYIWKTAPNMPYRFFLKVEATDRAGNLGADATKQPIVIDFAQPEGIILDVDPAK